jgi:Inhibitor of vertebrate lysozyme (Ivy)
VKIRLALIGLALATLLTTLASSAEEPKYPSRDLPPAAFRSWQKLVPENIRQYTWLSLFHGVESLMETLHKGSQTFFLGHVCKAHDCANNGVSFLIAGDGSEAYGLVRSAEASGGMDLFLGDPDEKLKEILLSTFPDQ